MYDKTALRRRSFPLYPPNLAQKLRMKAAENLLSWKRFLLFAPNPEFRVHLSLFIYNERKRQILTQKIKKFFPGLKNRLGGDISAEPWRTYSIELLNELLETALRISARLHQLFDNPPFFLTARRSLRQFREQIRHLFAEFAALKSVQRAPQVICGIRRLLELIACQAIIAFKRYVCRAEHFQLCG